MRVAVLIFSMLFGAQIADAQNLVWSDEFDYKGAPDTTKWNKMVMKKGAVNNELQLYVTDEQNCVVDGEYLHLKAINTDDGITSARLTSRHKGDWLYGRFEARIKVPSGVGTWPAFWMMPTASEYGGWPRSGEIDIMEYVGYAKDTIHGTVHTMDYNHTRKTQKGTNIYAKGVEDDFHIYTCVWSPEKIEIMVDGVRFFCFENDKTNNPNTWPFDKSFYIILNLAIGGDWGGRKGVAPDILPCEMVVDWVRVYK